VCTKKHSPDFKVVAERNNKTKAAGFLCFLTLSALSRLESYPDGFPMPCVFTIITMQTERSASA